MTRTKELVALLVAVAIVVAVGLVGVVRADNAEANERGAGRSSWSSGSARSSAIFGD